ncbi:hypothetical protein [Mesorhizobium amorphae]|uniref:hypothetical protein n=1 Tax=Mesorhizobium amorphae TaxID=71433 RepID=UPI0021B1A74F|nr:hypothetical protein [Mesorhizobium amorphae]
MTVVLKTLAETGRRAVVALNVTNDQDDFVASNAESLEEADENPDCVPLGIFVGDQPVASPCTRWMPTTETGGSID